ncbi:MAG: hypothetical protein KGJ21_01870, partial [Pseudomonadota bacterium]|nr:hypothetical protein [Pseudomonadota bacterium]
GTVIRCGLGGIRIAGRNTQGVTILKTQPGEKVVSVVTLPEATEEMNGGEEANDNAPDPATSAG